MKIKALRTAIAEAERFLRAAKEAHNSFGKDEYGNDYFPDTRLTAAAKRASMDLSRALSLIRART